MICQAIWCILFVVSSSLKRPLSDIRVVAVEQFGAGPWGTLQLADLGAEVIKIEDPTAGGDVARYIPPFAQEGTSLFFESFNRNKRSISLDLRVPESREVFEDLVRNSDAVFSNLRGDLPEKLGLRHCDLAHVNRRIVCVSLSGFGNTGPRAPEGAYDVTIQALAGWMALTGGPDAPPTKSGLSLVDLAAGYVAALGLLAGVWEARRDGVGRDVDLSLFETAISLLSYMGTWTASGGWEAQRLEDSAHQTIVPFQAFEASDGWLVVACAKERLWVKFCAAIGHPELAVDARFETFAGREAHRSELLETLCKILSRRTVATWLDVLADHKVPCAPVNNISEALGDRQVQARGKIVTYAHPVLGDVTTVASPFDGCAVRRGPLLGEDTEDILHRVCGYDGERVRRLDAQGVFGRAPDRVAS
jgi:crotonobetainyl-CoA:carnitine CoA-transferase CaiB-like acyl-CoA transferase